MIPVLITAVLNRPELLDKMLASVDVKVGTTFIVDNGDVLTLTGYGPSLRIIQPGHNLGVAASWNLGLKATPDAPWWFICGFDMTFAPGDLERFADEMDVRTGPRIGILEDFSAFAISRECLELVGYFDENFHPAYFEDNDYGWRAKLAHVELFRVEHGSKHVGSATIYGNPDYMAQNHETFRANRDYYIAKWGGLPGQENWTSPFMGEHGGGQPPIVPRRIRAQAWRRA